jgi:hypothetical protein
MRNLGRLHEIEVLVVGIEEMTSRDVVRSLVADGASVTAAGGDEAQLDHLQRDLALYRTKVKVAQIDLASLSEMGLFADNLRGQGRLPHIIVCCQPQPRFTLSESLALLKPSLVLHALPLTGARLGRAVANLNIPSLPDLLERGRGPGLFDPDRGPQRVVISRHAFMLRRWDSASGQGSARMSAANSRCDPAIVEAAQ